VLRDFNHLTLDYLARVDYGNGVEGREGAVFFFFLRYCSDLFT